MLFLINGCNDAPSSVGQGTIKYSKENKDFGEVEIKTLYATQSTIDNQLYTSGIDRFMVGKFQTYEAKGCIKFHTWREDLLGATIKSATLELHPFYHFGTNSTLPVNIDVYRAVKSVQNDSLDFTSLDASFLDPIIMSTFTIRQTDTLCSIPLDTAVVRQWFLTNAETVDTNDGMILQFKANPNAIMGFYSCNVSDTALQPTLYINYVDTSGVAGTYIHKTGSSRYVSTANRTSIVTNPVRMYVQNGISYRGLLDLNSLAFDSLALIWPFSIHQAILQITLDSISSSCNITPFENNILIGFSVGTDNKENKIAYTPSVQLSNSNVYQFDVSSMLPAWINNTYARKIAFRGYNESDSFDLFTFYGSGSSLNLRPKLIITYSAQR
jgi:hypothetical protein